ncbi:hypothetical protein ACN6AT_37065 (plasmid) [Streptomyces sp. JL4002]
MPAIPSGNRVLGNEAIVVLLALLVGGSNLPPVIAGTPSVLFSR